MPTLSPTPSETECSAPAEPTDLLQASCRGRNVQILRGKQTSPSGHTSPVATDPIRTASEGPRWCRTKSGDSVSSRRKSFRERGRSEENREPTRQPAAGLHGVVAPKDT